MTDIHKTLHEVFGFQTFRSNQEDIVQNIMNKKDVFAVMPTGGGKSLCYQLPARILHGTTIVISPLISLMKDQVDAALENGIAAALLNSSLNFEEKSDVYKDLVNKKIELFYIAPERFAIPDFVETLKTIPISLFAIDEAHCISEWGHDFRPDYLNLSNIVNTFSDVPVAAFTATATQNVQDDIINKLNLRSPYIVRASFNRQNLFYQVQKKQKVETQIFDFIQDHPDEPGIVYRTTRDSVEKLTEYLAINGVKALPYHAGLAPEVRKRNQDYFNKDKVNVIVATIAFGMGIDKSNVRYVIHGDLPKNIESYYQETGRSGRDGEPALCLYFFGRGDIPKMKHFFDQIKDENERTIVSEKMNQMIKYASHNICRRRQLLGYFGEVYSKKNCGACDVCLETVEKVDITTEAQIFLSAMYRTGQRFGIRHIIDIVSGSDTKRIRELGHNEIKTYGAGRHRDKKFWQYLVDELFAQEIIRQEGDKYPVLKLTKKGNNVLYGKEKFIGLKKEAEKEEDIKKTEKRAIIKYDKNLFESLRKLRKKLAEDQQVPPFVIFSDRTLHEMSAMYPETISNLKNINGVGETKLERYGDLFINEIKKYLIVNPDTKPTDSILASSTPMTKRIVGDTIEKTYELLKDGLSLEDIAEIRELTTSTIAGHVEQLIINGRDINVDFLIDPEKREAIEEVFSSFNYWHLTKVVEHFNNTISYDEARFARAAMQLKKSKIISKD